MDQRTWLRSHQQKNSPQFFFSPAFASFICLIILCSCMFFYLLTCLNLPLDEGEDTKPFKSNKENGNHTKTTYELHDAQMPENAVCIPTVVVCLRFKR